MKVVLRIVGAVAGATFGLLTSVALIRLLSGGNVVKESFVLLAGAPVGLLVGAILGAILGARAERNFRATAAQGSVRRAQRGPVLALAVGIPAAFAAVLWIGRTSVEPPSDAAMLRHFARHERTFDTVVDMANTDKGLNRVDENWTMPADTASVGVAPARLAEYRKLLRDAGTPRGFQVWQGQDELDFFFWLRGSAISDDTAKGFAYRTTPPTSMVQSLDGMRVNPKNTFTAYRHIWGNWYLFFRFIPD